MNQEEVQKYGQIAENVIDLFKQGDFSQIANNFGYALRFERDAAAAIKEDLNKSINEIDTTFESIFLIEPHITIKSFNEADMFDVLIEILFTHHKGSLLIELIKQTSSELCLEDISTFT